MHRCLHLSGVFGLFLNIYAPTNISVKDIGSWACMVLQNYQNFTEITSNMIYIIEVGAGLRYPRKIHLNTQSPLLLVLRLTNCPKRPSLDRSGNNATTLCLKFPINSLIGQKTISPHVPRCSGGPVPYRTGTC